jgi:hypothetical protein
MLKGRRLDVYSHDRPIFAGNYSHISATSLSGSSKTDGIFAARVTILDRDLSYLEDVLSRHECSAHSPKPRKCSHMCLLAESDFKGTCACPETLQLDKDRRTCIPIQAGEVVYPVICSLGRCRSTTTTTTTTTTILPPISGRDKSGKSDSETSTEGSNVEETSITKKPCKGKKCNAEKKEKDYDETWFYFPGIDYEEEEVLRAEGFEEKDRESRRQQIVILLNEY